MRDFIEDIDRRILYDDDLRKPNSTSTAPLTTNAAAPGSLAQRALEIRGCSQIEKRRATSDGRPRDEACLSYAEAFETARLESADVTTGDASRARESGERAVAALGGYTLLAVEEPFELIVRETLVIGAIDLLVRNPDGTIVVVDYKTGTLAGEKYALQLELYRRIAEERYPGERVDTAILRLAPIARSASMRPPCRRKTSIGSSRASANSRATNQTSVSGAIAAPIVARRASRRLRRSRRNARPRQ